MKKILVLIIAFALLATACQPSGESDSSAVASSDAATTGSATSQSETTPATTQPPTTTATTEQVETTETATSGSDMTTDPGLISPNQLTNFARFSDRLNEGMVLVSADQLDAVFSATPYDYIGAYDVKTGQAIATRQTPDGAVQVVIDQAGNVVEATQRYRRIMRLTDHLYFGFGEGDTNYVFDDSGTIYGSLSAYGEPVYEPLTHAFYVNNTIFSIDDTNKQISRLDGNLEAHFSSKYRKLESDFYITYHGDDVNYSYADGDEVESIIDYQIAGDYLIFEREQGEGQNRVNHYGLIKRGERKILDGIYADIGHLVDDYFYVASDLDGADEANGIYELRNVDKRSYPKAIYRGDIPLTEQIYYTIEPVAGDIFYVFDGENYHFISALSGQPIWTDMDLMNGDRLTGNFHFYQVGDCVIAVDDQLMPRVVVVIKDGVIVANYRQREAVAGGYVQPHYLSYAIQNYWLPEVVLEDTAAAKAINDYYTENYQTNDGREGGRYFTQATTATYKVLPHRSLIQMRMEKYVYAVGAAHPGYSYYSDVFLADSGRRMALADWFKKTEDYRQSLANYMLLDEANMTRSLFYEKSMTNDEVLAMFDFENANYYFTEKALVVYYNPYQFASFADGIVEFVVPFEELLDMFDAPARQLLIAN